LTDGLDRFNRMPPNDAERVLYGCFASREWAHSVAAGRPFADFAAVFGVCESAWAQLAPNDWQAAFAAHPRIGETGGHAPEESEREQVGVRTAAPDTMAALAEENRRYEARFGHVFLISASGRSADEILAALRQRMGNNPETEMAVAASEHRNITRVRLERMLNA
jgi:OHCU decarboxylase